MTIIARQKISGLSEPVFVGLACFCIGGFIPWALRPFSWFVLLLSGWFCLGGVVITVAGLRGWFPAGIGLILDREGLWWKRGRLHLLRWEDIAGVKLVEWSSEGVEEQGLLVGLMEGAKGPLDPSEMSWLSDQLKRQFGPLPWQKVIMLHHEKWQWNPTQIVATLEASLADPAMREQW
jgi:hypothetical protein